MNQVTAKRRTAVTLLGESEGHKPARSRQTSGTWVSSMGNAAVRGTPASERSSWRSCDVKPVVCCTVKNRVAHEGVACLSRPEQFTVRAIKAMTQLL